ncbi:MAG: hypothetical protein ABWZ77_06570 [Naasia sp.]
MGYRSDRKMLAAAAAMAIISGGLFGCVNSAPSPLPVSPPPSVTASTPSVTAPSPSETAAAPVADRVHVTAEALTVSAADGTAIVSFHYRQLTAEVVAGLTAHLGEPEEGRFPAGNHNGEGASYLWESLLVTSQDRWAAMQDDELPAGLSRWSVRVTGPTARGLAVDTIDGIRVGDSTDAVMAANPGAGEAIVPGGGLPRVDIYIGSVAPPLPVETHVAEEPRWRVWLMDEEPTDVIQEFFAPSLNYGA